MTDTLTKELADALRQLVNGAYRPCGHTFDCACPCDAARTALARYDAAQDTPESAQQLDTREREMELALHNCRMLAHREIRNYEGGGQKPTGVKAFAAWKHILRFCEEAGVTGSILRVDADTPSDKEPKA